MDKKISIIIPVYNEERYIESCITSIVNSDVDKEALELLLVDGRSSDSTREIIHSFQKKYSFVKWVDNPHKTAPFAMNLGIKEVEGAYIFILSAHAFYPKDYFNRLVVQMDSLNADCVGGVLSTEVKNQNKKSNAIKKVLMHPLGVGNATFRTGSKEIQEVDTVAFGCYKKSVFDTFGYYDEKLTRNQDIELNKRIVNGGGKIYLIPDVHCTYYARENFTDLARNNFANGKWNILTAYYTKILNSLSLRHFVPLIFVLMLILPVVFSIFYSKLVYLSVLTLLSYLALVIIISLKLKDKTTTLFDLMGSFLTLHLSYGAGSIAGVFSVIQKYIKGDR